MQAPFMYKTGGLFLVGVNMHVLENIDRVLRFPLKDRRKSLKI